MESTIVPVNLGLSEFVAKLVEETLEAVLDSQLSQLKKQSELNKITLLPLRQFADFYITEQEIDERLLVAFSGKIILANSIFNKKNEETLKQLEIELLEGEDIKKERLTAIGLAKVRDAFKMILAFEKKSILKDLASIGIPRLQIDAGEITAKVNFSTTKTEEVKQGNKSKSMQLLPSGTEKFEFEVKPVIGKNILAKSLNSQLLNPVRVAVSQASSSNNSSVSAFGEIKIQFKTIW